MTARKPATQTWVRRLGPPDIAVLRLAGPEQRPLRRARRPTRAGAAERADAKAFLSDERTVCLVAFVGNDPIGFLYANELYRRHGDLSHLCLYEIGVAEEYRGSGVGPAAVRRARRARATSGASRTASSSRTRRTATRWTLFDKVGAVRGARTTWCSSSVLIRRPRGIGSVRLYAPERCLTGHQVLRPLATRFCDLVGVRYPIVQTGMGWVSGARLTAATSAAGGLGILAAVTMTDDQLRQPSARR